MNGFGAVGAGARCFRSMSQSGDVNAERNACNNPPNAVWRALGQTRAVLINLRADQLAVHRGKLRLGPGDGTGKRAPGPLEVSDAVQTDSRMNVVLAGEGRDALRRARATPSLRCYAENRGVEIRSGLSRVADGSDL